MRNAEGTVRNVGIQPGGQRRGHHPQRPVHLHLQRVRRLCSEGRGRATKKGPAPTTCWSVTSNYCIVREDGSIQFPYEGGPEGYAFDVRDDTDHETRRVRPRRVAVVLLRIKVATYLGDNWGSMPDEDWFRLEELEADTEYEVYLEADPDVPEKHRLTRPRIVGIYDEHGNEVQRGRSRRLATDTSVSLTFQTASSGNGFYYLAVGSNPGDRTGLYSFYVRHTVSNNVEQCGNQQLPDRRARHHRFPQSRRGPDRDHIRVRRRRRPRKRQLQLPVGTTRPM